MLENKEIKTELYQIFDYIREIYLKLFSPYLSEEKINFIRKLDEDLINIDEEAEYKIKINNKLNFNMNIEKFIENNDLYNNYTDIGKEEIEKIEYILNNKDNSYKIIKDQLLETSIIFLMDARTCLELGTASYVTLFISQKCNIKANINYPKEMEVVRKIIKVIGDNNFFDNLLNNKTDELIRIYNQYDSGFKIDYKFENILKDMNKIFNNYYRCKDKVYYTDLLYYYNKLDYSDINKKIDDIISNKEKMNNNIKKRIDSIIECIEELNRYKIILNQEDNEKIYYAKINIDGVLRKSNLNIDNYYKILEYEKEIKPVVDKIWNYYVNYEGEYNSNEQYYFLIENYESRNNNYLKRVNLITNDDILVSDIDNRFQYGFIYKIKKDSIIYSAPNKIIYTDCDDKSYCENINIININDIKLEIENQIYSILMTPRMLMLKTKEEKALYNTVLLDSDNIMVSGIYCITNKEMNDINYEKAKELAEKYDLPLIPIKKSIYEK